MTGIDRILMVFALAIVMIAGTRVYDAYAGNNTPRYTPRELVKLRAHGCKEDEYMFIPSRRVNDRVTYNTPDRAMCVAIELTRRADG